MQKNYIKIVVSSILISSIGVFIIDYFFHLFFSAPMETTNYFIGKMTLYFVFSLVFLLVINIQKKELLKVFIAGIIVASMWGMYYNVLPLFFDYYPQGIALNGLTFLGMGLLGTGIAFGIVHTLAFMGGYYANKSIFKLFNNSQL